MTATFTIRVDHYLHNDPELTQAITDLRSLIVTSNAELTSQLNDLKAQLDAAAATNAKAKDEIVAAVAANSGNVTALNQRIAELEAIIAAGGSDVPPEVVEAFTGVKASADVVTASSQALDALNPDSP